MALRWSSFAVKYRTNTTTEGWRELQTRSPFMHERWGNGKIRFDIRTSTCNCAKKWSVDRRAVVFFLESTNRYWLYKNVICIFWVEKTGWNQIFWWRLRIRFLRITFSGYDLAKCGIVNHIIRQRLSRFWERNRRFTRGTSADKNLTTTCAISTREQLFIQTGDCRCQNVIIAQPSAI